ncbi:A24 family peptidase [Actinobacillus pleuropneumoniae]|uniref:A24 family peptidase n=1 Tax=Actinobacillus pleuropneumoniae TaxID=715 RepID=UPI001EEDB0DC|nr:prepilin peptidase [Actinobacillus pleuropneumoniae]UKH14094.1 flp operon protein B [Actinobacillus pleuropneumoniae]
MTLFISTLIAIMVCLLLVVCWTDLRYRLISNRVIMALLLVIIPFSYLMYGTLSWLPAVLCLVIGFVLFLLNVIGAGDVKLLAVLMLAIPSSFAIFFLFLTACAGLLLIIIGWLFYRKTIREKGLPYGIAISTGFLTTLLLFN